MSKTRKRRKGNLLLGYHAVNTATWIMVLFLGYLVTETIIWTVVRVRVLDKGMPDLKATGINLAIAAGIYILIRLSKHLIVRKRLAGASMKQIDKMTGEEFEQYLGILYSKKGYKVRFTPGTMDFGADLIIEKDGIVTAIQAKRYRNNVGEASVQQALSGKEYYGADSCAVVTNSHFTNAAKMLAERCRVGLYDREMLYKGRVI